jgi:phage FluMu gp28-like protein
VAWCREIIARRRIKFAQQDALLDDAMKRYRVMRLCMDQTGMGEKPVEDAQRRYGEHMVEGVLMTGPMKLHLATIGKQGFEDRKDRIPMGDRDTRSDLHSLKRIILPSGAHRFDADRSENGHADRAWAKFLSRYAGSSPYQAAAYHSASPAAMERDRRRGEFDDDDYRGVKTTAGFNSRPGVI